MKIEVLVFTLIIQLGIQITLYLTTVKFAAALIKLPAKTLSNLHMLFDMTKQETCNGVVALCLIGYNILLSLLVLKFTATSALAGITNLGASVGVGVFMTLHFRKGGKYYIETKETNLLGKLKNKVRRIK